MADNSLLIENDKIYIYPICGRPLTQNSDANQWLKFSSLNSEVNIANMTHSLSNKNFVIEGFKFAESKITAGKCIINGHFIQIAEAYNLSISGTDIYVFLKLNRHLNVSPADTAFNQFKSEVYVASGIEGNNPAHFGGCEYLLESDWQHINDLDYLLLGVYKEGSWRYIKSLKYIDSATYDVDITNSVDERINVTKFYANNISIKCTKHDINGLNHEVLLENYIQDVVIDDGRFTSGNIWSMNGGHDSKSTTHR